MITGRRRSLARGRARFRTEGTREVPPPRSGPRPSVMSRHRVQNDVATQRERGPRWRVSRPADTSARAPVRLRRTQSFGARRRAPRSTSSAHCRVGRPLAERGTLHDIGTRVLDQFDQIGGGAVRAGLQRPDQRRSHEIALFLLERRQEWRDHPPVGIALEKSVGHFPQSIVR